MDSSEGDVGPRTQMRQQKAVADLGQQALETDDIDRLLYDAVVAVTETLDTEFTEVIELLPDDDEAFLRQGEGWRDGLIGSATVPTDLDSQAGYTLCSQVPVIVEDLRGEERFSGPELLTSHDVISGISVVIGSVDDPWGIFGVHTTERREFTEHDATFVKNVANVLAAAIDRVEKERCLRDRERRLERYKEYTDDILTAVDDVFYVIDEAGNFRRWNESLNTVTGYSDTEIASMYPTEFVAEEDRNAIANEIAAVFDTGSGRIEADVVTKDGKRIPYEFTASRLETPDGTSVLAGIGRDVTEREERTQELAKYERIVETINDGIYVADENGCFQMVNEAYTGLTGYNREELRGEHATRVVDESTIERAGEIRAEMADDETVNPTMEETIETAGGDRLPVEATFASLPTDDGEERVGVVRDITDRKERERALEESERRYRTLVEHFPNGAVGLFNDDLRYTAIGGELVEAVGISPDDRIGSSVHEIYPDELVETVEPYFEAALEGEANSFDVEYHDRYLFAYTLPVRNADDEVFAGMVVVRDVTERREYQRQLEESNERLQQFAYAASHDLQEPLRMVSSYLQLLERRYGDEFDDDAEEFVEFAVNGAERMREMIEGLLEYSRVDTQGDPLGSVELDDVLDDAIENLQVKIEESDAEIATEPLPRVEGDDSQLQQVFQNFLSNAIEYSGDEPPQIQIEADRNGGECVISIHDEGIGIDPDELDRVFEVFQRLHSRDEHAGTGIGLALCERIVERHGGEISVDSEPDEGSTFSFTLAVVDP